VLVVSFVIVLLQLQERIVFESNYPSQKKNFKMSAPPNMDSVSVKVKKSRKERLHEQREFEKSLGLNKGIGGVQYDKVAERYAQGIKFIFIFIFSSLIIVLLSFVFVL
jgi:hypothetical protein